MGIHPDGCRWEAAEHRVAIRMRQLVERLGGHPLRELGIDPNSPEDRGRWLIAACLRSGRVEGAVAGRAYRSLVEAGLPSPSEIAAADPITVAMRLADVGYPKPEVAAQRVFRASSALVERWNASLEELASEACDLDDLGARITRLAPGLGAATALQFLRPLRDVWAAARETPLSPASLAAGEHLGWLRAGEDSDGEPGALRAALANEVDPPELADVEAALDRLGRRACGRNRPERCPLGDDCPARAAGVAGAALRE